MLQLVNVSKKFADKEVLSKINLHVHKEDTFGIIGYSGAGKSTLLRLMNALETVSSGNIILDGQDITKLSGTDLLQLRRKIGMIFQNFNLFNQKTIFENIAFPLEIIGLSKSQIKTKVNDLISLVNLESYQNSYPSSLSGGQKQRVGIARALANDPKILLCDEATSALDPSNTKMILNLLKDIKKQIPITIVLITHEMEVVQNICNKVAVIDSGNIVEQGDTHHVFNHPQNIVTKDLVIKGHDHDDSEDIISVIESFKQGSFLKIHYSKDGLKEAIISEITLKFNIKVSIIEALIHNNNGELKGDITAYINDTPEMIQAVIDFVKSKNIAIEVIDN